MKQFLSTLCLILVWCPGKAQDTDSKEDFATIRNGPISAKIKFMGAELVSLKNDLDGLEYIWQGDEDNWSNSSPVLFPIIGSLKEGSYVYDGKYYEMPQHGFAMGMRFDLIHQDDDKVIFSLKANESTLQAYPFGFELQVAYQLQGKELTVRYRVFNTDGKTMFFSIGGHPGFNIPIGENSLERGPYLAFNKKETANIFSRQGKLLDGKEIPYMKKEKQILINEELFKDGARIFFDLRSDKVSIHAGKRRILSLVFDDFPYLAIWSRPSNPGFICLEPWHGIPDFVETDQNLEKKKGIIALKPQKEFSCQYSIKI